MASSARRVSKHRENLRAQGLKPVQIWVYDTKDPEFRARVKSWSLSLKDSAHEREIMDWIEAAQDSEGWEAEGYSWDDGEPV